MRRAGRVARQATIAALFAATALLGTFAGVFVAFAGDLEQISALDSYEPPTITRVLARDGRVIQEFATERRVVIGYDEIAPRLREAILASEDAGFEHHLGFSLSRIAVTAARELFTGRRAGASTITQQVARMLFLQSEYMTGGTYVRSGFAGWERKIKEGILAIQLEKRYTKREIFAFYANHVPLGHGAYGVEAASRMYFDKPASDLTLDEAATVAAIIPGPQRHSPFVNPDRTLAQRNSYVLPRMARVGFITSEEAGDASQRPLVIRGERTAAPSIAPHFAEEIRKMLEQRYGADDLYQAGLRVETTLDADLQKAANAAMDRGLRRLDKRQGGYRRAARNVLDEGAALDRVTFDRWARPSAEGDIVPALVTAVAPATDGGAAHVRIARHEVELAPPAFAWTGRTAATELFEVGDVIEVEVRALRDGAPAELLLEQPSAIEGALLAIDNRTGQIRAMIGGADFARSRFNRSIQAQRQVGSLFKAVVFTAAIDRGFTPVSIFVDEPVEYDAGPNQPPYAPRNYDRMFEGPVTLRRALEQSRNVPAVKAMVEVGPQQVVNYARRFGLRGDYPLYLSVALGAIEGTLLEMTSGYSAFANRGVRMEPYSVVSIADREGNVLEEHRPRPHEAIRADTAFVMTNLLRGTIQRGTGSAAASLDWPLAGKTGTVNDNTDAWFIGFDPDITVGVWVGHDVKKPLGPSETGGSAALPIWMEFMRAYIDAHGDRTNPPTFDPPGNIVFVTLDSGVQEAFISGTQPQAGFPMPWVTPMDDVEPGEPVGPDTLPGILPVPPPVPAPEP